MVVGAMIGVSTISAEPPGKMGEEAKEGVCPAQERQCSAMVDEGRMEQVEDKISNVSTASAQTTPLNLKKPLALKECSQIALENSSRLTIAKRDVMASELEVKDARAGYLPKVDAAAGYKVNNTCDKIEWTENHYDVGLSLTESFYDNGMTSAKIEQAKARLKLCQLDFQKIEDDLIFEVTKNYYALLKAQRMLQVKIECLKQAQTHLALARARYDVGCAPKSDCRSKRVIGSERETYWLNWIQPILKTNSVRQRQTLRQQRQNFLPY